MIKGYYNFFSLWEIKFSLIIFTFIYILHYPLTLIFDSIYFFPKYPVDTWLFAFLLILVSIPIYLYSLYVGITFNYNKVSMSKNITIPKTTYLKFNNVLLIFLIINIWSFIMIWNKIGITIYPNFDPLPYRLAGILFYTRLLIFPIIIAVIARMYKNTHYNFIIFLLIFITGIISVITSGSRLVGLFYAFPILYLYAGKGRIFAFGVFISIFLITAQLSRIYMLPEFLDDIFLKNTQGDDISKSNSSDLSSVLFMPISYVVVRTLSLKELLAVLTYGEITPTIFDSFLKSINIFLPFNFNNESKDIHDILGFSSYQGGVALDIFGTLWLASGGVFFFYIVTVSLVGFILGKICFYYSIIFDHLSINFLNEIFFFLVFILIMFEGRYNLMIPILCLGWVFSRLFILKIIINLFKN